MTQTPHRRYNPLTGEWILVSPHRMQRPWEGETAEQDTETPVTYDETCSLCPGNTRANGLKNPEYESVYVFTNDFSALLPDPIVKSKAREQEPLFQSQSVCGTCRVICYSPSHNLTLSQMSQESIVRVIEMWRKQIEELGSQFEHVQVFENKGEMVGCSNSHPHGQIWACNYIPDEVRKENKCQDSYYKSNNASLLIDYLHAEHSKTKPEENRIVLSNAHWSVIVPYWGYWPFETLLLPHRNGLNSMLLLTQEEQESLADILLRLCKKYDALFSAPFPYVMGWHGESRIEKTCARLLHCHFYPPLVRSASIRKHRAGFEMLAEAQRDFSPELAAARLREV